MLNLAEYYQEHPWYTPEGLKATILWMRENLWVKARSGKKLVRFVPNKIQRRLLGYMAAQRRSGVPIRIIILKARQEGCSTLVAALFYTLVFNTPNTNAFVAAHTDVDSRTLFDKVTLFHNYLYRNNPELKAEMPLIAGSRNELIWSPPHNSKYQVHTAGSKYLRSGDTIQLAHLSELPKWEAPTEPFIALMNAVTDDVDSICIIESTAVAEGDLFHEQWMEAVEHQLQYPGASDGYLPVFFSWLEGTDNRMKVPANYKGPPLSEEEILLRDVYGADREQLFWRRWAIRVKCGGDLDLFHRENPTTAGEAFLASGRPGIPLDIVRLHRSQEVDPRYGRFEWADELRKGADFLVEDDVSAGSEPRYSQLGLWRVWEEPVERMDYAIGADVAEGLLSDTNDPKSKPDLSAIVVIDRSTMAVVAAYVGRPSPHELAIEMEKACRAYNDAYLTPEVNNHGYSTLEKLIEDGFVDRLYHRSGSFEHIETHEPHKYGWITGNSKDRYWLIHGWIEACHSQDQNSPTAPVLMRSKEIANEEATFIIDGKGKRQHKAGAHDDMLFAAMIAIQVHKWAPRARRGAYVGTDGKIRPGGRDYLYVGGRDPGILEDTGGGDKWVTT